jgi:hypothetical protein
MKRSVVISLSVVLLMRSVAAEETYGSGYEPKPPVPFPSTYKDYQILPGTISPDQRHAFVYPKRSVLFDIRNPRLFLAALDPFRILSHIPTSGTLLTANARGYYAANWSKDSSTAVFVAGSRWGPEKVWVLEFRDGKVASQTDVTAVVRQQVLPDYRKSHAERYNDYYDFVFDEDHEDTDGWKLDDAGQLIIDTVCTTDPKALDPHGWTAEFKGTWDISGAKFVQKSVARIPPRPNQTLERTADRSVILLSMTSTLNLEAELALVSGRSACSR